MEQLMTLDENVLAALSFFEKKPPPGIDVSRFNLPFVVGSGNAYNTGIILFSQQAAVFADESNFRTIIASFKPAIEKKIMTDGVIISASGGKDSVWETELAQASGLHTTLLTTKPDSPAAKKAETVIAFRSIAEPYTYNVSTYMGMIMGATGEKADAMRNAIESLVFPDGFTNYDAYAFVLPDRFAGICPMLDIKKSELFGPYVSLRAFSDGHARHAKFVIRSPKELVISVGLNNQQYGDPASRWDIPLPDSASHATVMAMTYYITGKIQTAKQPYYLNHIGNYVADYGPRAYGKTEPFELMVPGSE